MLAKYEQSNDAYHGLRTANIEVYDVTFVGNRHRRFGQQCWVTTPKLNCERAVFGACLKELGQVGIGAGLAGFGRWR